MEQFIGYQCTFEDYLGQQRLGKIVAIEAYQSTFLCYVADELNNDNNNKADYVNGVLIRYADIRTPSEIALLDYGE